MPDTGWLKEVLEEVKQEVDSWPAWLRERQNNAANCSLDDRSSTNDEPESRLSEPRQQD